MKIRTRYAPSPTGHLHLGGLRTALFNWLWAQKNAGEFILRLEDTDQARLVPEAQEQLIEDLRSLGLNWDFGPDKPNPEFGSCVQSQRLKIYQSTIEELLRQEIAYQDYSSPKRLQELRHQAQLEKKPFIFRRSLAQLQPTQSNQDPVIRIAIPQDLNFNWHDTVKGQQNWLGKDIGDFVALKSDGWPTYHLANVIDDHLMQISHVIRADEWLSSTPKHLYLFDCLHWQRPQYVHVPHVLSSQNGQKLSKRSQGGRVVDFLKDGYLQVALLNYLSLLGWNPKNEQEIFTIPELIKAFDIANIQVAGARFDVDRLDWFNGKHLRALDSEQRLRQAEGWWPSESQDYDAEYKLQVLELLYQRLKKWSQLKEDSQFFFQTPPALDSASLSRLTKLEPEAITTLIDACLRKIEEIEFTAGELELHLYQLAQTENTSPSKFFSLLRLKLTGREVSPGLFSMMEVLGLATCQARLQS